MLSKTLWLNLGLSFCIISIVALFIILPTVILYHESKKKRQDKDNIEIGIKLNLLKFLSIEFFCKVNKDK